MACRAQGSAPVESVSFVLNGQPVVVQGANPLLSLNEWLRAQPQLGGTKIMCGEGGCGVCVVTVARPDPVNKKEINIAVNSVSKVDNTPVNMLFYCSVSVLCFQWKAGKLQLWKVLESELV